jgi:hypothetical protein
MIHLEKHVTLFHVPSHPCGDLFLKNKKKVPWMLWKGALAIGGQKAAALTIVTGASTR